MRLTSVVGGCRGEDVRFFRSFWSRLMAAVGKQLLVSCAFRLLRFSAPKTCFVKHDMADGTLCLDLFEIVFACNNCSLQCCSRLKKSC
jgi:hypothetical protein